MINRRDFFGITVGAGATLAVTPELLRALQQSGGKLIQRAIPSSGEMLPLIGLGRGNDAPGRAALEDLKYVISHPAVTAVRVGTSQAKHMLDNLGGGMGRLPNEATRKRMAELVDSLGRAVAVRVPASVLERYAGEYEFPNYAMLVRLNGDTLTSQRVGLPLTARTLVPVSETRFRTGSQAGEIEFVIDQAGVVTKVMRVGSQEVRGRRKPKL